MSALGHKRTCAVQKGDVRFVPIADMLQSRSRRPRIRFLQKQGRKLFVFAQEFFDVILHLNTGMDNRPKMSGSDKSKKREDILETFAAKGLSQCISGTLRLRRVHKDQSAKRKQLVFDFATRNGPIDRLSWPPSYCKSVRGPAAKAEVFAEARSSAQ